MSQSSLTPINVVAGLIFRQQGLLVCQRCENAAFPLKWEFPGGKVEHGESNVGALKRELKEELDIEVQRASEIFSYTHSYPNALQVSLRFFRVDQFYGKIRNLVFRQISWVGVGDLSTLDFLDGDLPLIRKLLTTEGANLLHGSKILQ
jgi:8-oxo-dGTP diphosphatase